MGSKAKILRSIITNSYDLGTVEENFDVAIKTDLTLTRLVKANARCSKCEGYGHYMIISALRRVDMLVLCLVMMLMTQKLLRMSTFFSKITSIIEDVPVGSDTSIIDERHASYEGLVK